MTCAPRCLAIWHSSRPTPPAAACIRQASFVPNRLHHQLLQDPPHGPQGRPKGSADLTDDALRRRLIQARNRLHARGERPTQVKVMAQMGIRGDPKQVRDWLRRLGIASWNDFLAWPCPPRNIPPIFRRGTGLYSRVGDEGRNIWRGDHRSWPRC